MRPEFCLALVFALVAESAVSGAWQRERGAGFAAGSAILRDGSAPREFSLFTEYGLRPDLTIGLDVNGRADKVGHALLFARIPIARPGRTGRLALQLGLGLHHYSGDTAPMGRFGFLYGRSLGTTGWFGVEPAVEYRSGLGQPLYKLDAVLGLPASGPVQAMIKLETIYKHGYGAGWTLTPGVILGRRNGARWIAGVEYKRGGGTDSIGLALGLWHSF